MLEDLDDLLSNSHHLKRCKICADDTLSRATLRWLCRKADPEDECFVTLSVFHRILVQLVTYQVPVVSTLRAHVRDCLLRDHRTGGPLDA